MEQRVSVGMDVSKKNFEGSFVEDLKVKKAPRLELSNSKDGFEKVLKWGQELAGDRKLVFCMESTGGYERALARYLASKGAFVCVENPRRIKQFAGALGITNKTDRVDARAIALYALSMPLNEWVQRDDLREELRDLTHRRKQLQEDLTRLRNRKEHGVRDGLLSRQIAEEEQTKLGHIEEIDKELKRITQEPGDVQGQIQALTGIPGIANLTATTLIAEMPDPARFDSAESWAAQAGLYPRRKESGQWKGQTRMCKAGNGRVRRALYMGTSQAKKLHPGVRDMAERLAAAGKKPMQIRIACMRKLLMLCYGILKALREGKPIFYGVKPGKIPATP